MEQPKAHPKPSEPANIPSRRTQQTRNIWAWGVPSATTFNEPKDTVLFSSSLPSALSNKREHIVQPMDIMFPVRKQLGTYNRVTDTMDDVAQHLIGNLLPDNEEELLAGVINDFDHVRLQNQAEELEEYDVFHNSGGMELDFDPLEIVTFSTTKASVTNNIGSGSSQYNLQTAVGTVTGEHPFGEHPSRTLFVRNINSNVEDSELCSLFEIRETPQKRHHRFIEFYDVRAAEAALRSLNKSDIAGKRVKLEPSRPGGARRSFVQPSNYDFDQDETRHNVFHFGSPSANSAPSLWSQIGSPIEHNQLNTHSETSFSGGMSPLSEHGGIMSGSPVVSSAASSTSTASGFTTMAWTPFLWGNKSTLREHSLPSAFHSLPLSSSHLSNSRTQRQDSPITFMVPSGHQSTSYVRPSKFGSIGPSHVGGSLMTNFGLRSQVNAQSMQSVGFNGLFESGQNHAVGNTGGQEDSRMQYQLDLEKIVTGEDTRTTLVIKNIPNKYTQKMLLDVIDETHERTYDFFYLPVDLKNKCNVGYAFINMIYPSFIVSFHKILLDGTNISHKDGVLEGCDLSGDLKRGAEESSQ
ncbi:hypothetical protein PR202_gb06995 [Eleusine coracana subsp. coracana]|uniref:RRM domain-containing protein n=1 Tax=Eleusine coracana subsp. coracana TaxID=191504 RepID=A0AAV5E8L6_ELECO|nr:hypothetical protein PR202_gb06995 [Eleusine coracana subsp. coracana]